MKKIISIYYRKLALIILISLLGQCISCGIRLGPPEREIEKSYKHAEILYNDIMEGYIGVSPQNWDRIITNFEEIVEKYPKSSFADDAQYNIGLCYIWAYKILDKSPEKSIKAFETLIKKYPKSEFVDDAYYWKAYAYSLLKDYRKSIEEYEKFVRNYPKSDYHKEALARIDEFRIITDGQKKKVPVEKPEEPLYTLPKKEEDEIKKMAEQKEPSIESIPIQKKQETQLEKEKPMSKESKKSDESDGLMAIKDIRFHSGPEFTRVVLDMTGETKYSANRLYSPDRIYLDLQNTTIVPPSRNIEVKDGVIISIRISKFDKNTTRLVLDINEIYTYIVFHLKNPDRVVIDVYGLRSRSISPPEISKSPPPTKKSPDLQEDTHLVKQLGLKVRTIVIDPGHGGKDPGAVSKSGTQEKHLVLDVGLQLKKILESSGQYQVYMTRETDVFVELEKRTAFANEKEGDIFISIHINSSKNSVARGIETYYLSMASDEEARATAALENAPSGRTISELNSIIRYILRGAKIEESRELARTVQSHLSSYANKNDRGVKRAPFIVLIGANAPSILVELGFMSNKNDEELLLNQEYRRKLAKAIAEAIESYIKTIDQTS